MVLTEEKHNLIHCLNINQLEEFNGFLMNLDYEDYEDFTYMFVNDMQNLFYGCNEEQFTETLKYYDSSVNIFE